MPLVNAIQYNCYGMESADDACVFVETYLDLTHYYHNSHGNTRMDVHRERMRLATSGVHGPL